MCFVFFGNKEFLVGFVIFMFLSCFCHCFNVPPMTCNASLTESCPASLYYVPTTMKSLEEMTALFHVNSDAINRTVDGFVIAINCSCPAEHTEFTSHVDYTIQPSDTWELISSKFGSLVEEKPDKVLIPSLIVTLDLFCGCFNRASIITYRVKTGDTLFTICSRFKASLQKTIKLNNLTNPELIHDGDIIFIPEPGGLQNLILLDNKDPKAQKISKLRIHIVIGVLSAAVTVGLLLAAIVSWNFYHKRKGNQQSKACSRRIECLPCCLAICPFHTKSEESVILSFYSDKAIVFPYNEVRDATFNFDMSLKIGQGSYGSVYLGKLRGSDAAIKQMKNTKSKEFMSELNILCKVHHKNVIELIGYAAGGDSLFLVYELAQNGALSDHLHSPTVKGYKPLSWTTRVQIALDAAKGLEYIHVHTKPYYVHRDVKTSNILLDSNFRAKIADFGLVKLLEHSPELGAAASRIVGTFGYLAPEYVRDGCVSTKNDVYSFGVVLMELVTGQPALSRDASPRNDQYSEHRSLVEYMLSALDNTDNSFIQLIKCVDPNLTHYHEESLVQMALLSKDCVDEDWNQRPDMCKVVLRLSHILTCSREWEKLEMQLLKFSPV